LADLITGPTTPAALSWPVELTADGRSLAQGALAWVWGRSPATLPLPGFRTVGQVDENVSAAGYGPLGADAMERIQALLGEPLPA
jgi:aryl-alcohol dehydrogenase-like predicted oxidoreductase